MFDRTVLMRDSERVRAAGLLVEIGERRPGEPSVRVETLLDAFDRLPPSGEWLVSINGGSTYWDSHFPDRLFSEMIDVVLEEVQSGGSEPEALPRRIVQSPQMDEGHDCGSSR
jgi:hypothetical protein